jgi:histidinol phosphatase-like enzyme
VLDKIIKKEVKPRKWNWHPEALETVKEAQDDKTRVQELLTRDLVKLCTWPSKELARDHVLIEDKGDFVTSIAKETGSKSKAFRSSRLITHPLIIRIRGGW